ncbi:MAG TPA: ABC transporter permease [Alphaproteobacteria bacterium]|nr:ABC transporter permease [Alphaproteobacteria bacterium]
MATRFSAARLMAVLLKEFIQMRRDRVTFAMMIGVPILQLTLFGFAINADPKRLPTAVLAADNGPFARSIVRAMENSEYFTVVRRASSEAETRRLIETGEVQFVVNVPAGFSRDILRGERPALLVEVDATDPVASGNALAVLARLESEALSRDMAGPTAELAPAQAPFEMRVHRLYNPEGITRYNIVPGLMGVVLTLTMVVMTALAVTRERERGTMEALLAMPVRPVEVMLGKILPYIAVGYMQVIIILLAARFVFGVPNEGSLVLLSAAVILFIAANLCVGFTFSTVAQNQLQAMQMSMFFFLPSILLSGFMFPFRGMPGWAQALGEILPLTHFLRVVRGILLKGNGASEVLVNAWPLAAFLAVAVLIALRRYRQTLD